LVSVVKSRSVLFVGDLLHPVGAFAVEQFDDGDVGHGRGRRRAVPMLFARWEPDDIARTDFLDRPAFALHPAGTGGDDQRLAQRVRVPRSARARLEGDAGAKPAGGTDTSNKSAAATPSRAASTTGSEVATQLKTMHMQTMEQVRTQQGAAFDSAFVNAQVMGHQQVLDLLQRAQSQAQNPSVQQHLTASMKDVQSHLERAQQLQQRLASGATSDSATKGKTDTSSSKADTGRAKGDTSRRP
jgi:hypothetical protein